MILVLSLSVIYMMIHDTYWCGINLGSKDMQCQNLCGKFVKSDCVVHALASRSSLSDNIISTHKITQRKHTTTITTTLNVELKVLVIVIVINSLYPSWSIKNHSKRQSSTTMAVMHILMHISNFNLINAPSMHLRSDDDTSLMFVFFVFLMLLSNFYACLKKTLLL